MSSVWQKIDSDPPLSQQRAADARHVRNIVAAAKTRPGADRQGDLYATRPPPRALGAITPPAISPQYATAGFVHPAGGGELAHAA